MLIAILLLIYFIIAVSIVISVLINGVKPSKSLAWLLAIFTVPVGGILLYLILGRNRRKNKVIQLQNAKSLVPPLTPADLSYPINGQFRNLMTLVYENSKLLPTRRNKLQLLKDGKSTFEAIFEALESAEKQIHLLYYIFEEGELADRLLSLFEQKIKQGVQVRMIYDGIGSFSLSKKYIKKLISMGVEVYPFLPFKFGRFLSSLNYRNHRKIIVVDGKIAFTGGINISDKYLKGDPELGNWHDMHLRLEGPATCHLNYIFAMDWNLVSQIALPPLIPSYNLVDEADETITQIVSGGPDDDFPALEQVYFSIINRARDYLYITNPYIIPGHALMQALQTAALSGVDVRLMVSENADNTIVSWCVRSYFEPLLKTGVKIYLFPDGFLHSKILVSDDNIATIGTANLDDRSFEQNYEVNAIIYDQHFATLLKKDFLEDSRISRVLDYETHVQRSWGERLKEGFGKVFSPVL
ncbi:cardiolipin synthase [Muriicola sp. Z0-33]|uniref:cardiolipin synthase n=1 Tax=Muriicola sp. Z0-33 TaxID=2816957 RepID=UPI0022375B2C|nr:cardiolipin synthase [Muriicola sp. Z0-33]MCW5515757.1 cardiolipin synthase [Muriicola sp. Z0-33]